MADYYYYLEVYDARPPHDGGVINPVKGVRRKTSPHFELEFLTEDHATGGSAKTAFLNHYDDKIVSAPKPINLLAAELRAALVASATETADGQANSGRFGKRVGKYFFGYFIGVSTVSFAEAKTNGVYHNFPA